PRFSHSRRAASPFDSDCWPLHGAVDFGSHSAQDVRTSLSHQLIETERAESPPSIQATLQGAAYVVGTVLVIWFAISSEGTDESTEESGTPAPPLPAPTIAVHKRPVDDNLDPVPNWDRSQMLRPIAGWLERREPSSQVHTSWLLGWREYESVVLVQEALFL